MSLIDEFRTLEASVASRLQELRPAVAEYEQLQDVAKRLGIDPEAPSPAKPSRRPAPRRRGAAAGKRGASRKPGGSRTSRPAAASKRSEEIVAKVNERPGITVAELGKSLGVDPTGLYRPIRRLTSEGSLRKDGTALHPAKS